MFYTTPGWLVCGDTVEHGWWGCKLLFPSLWRGMWPIYEKLQMHNSTAENVHYGCRQAEKRTYVGDYSFQQFPNLVF